MSDSLFSSQVAKVRPLCANPLCGKTLSRLNKQSYCFGCHDKALMNRLSAPPWASTPPKVLPWPHK